MCVVASRSSGGQTYRSGEQHEEVFRQLIFNFCASKLKSQEYLGRRQGKQNVLNFFSKKCVINYKDHASISGYRSHLFKLNSVLILKVAYLNIGNVSSSVKSKTIANRTNRVSRNSRNNRREKNSFITSVKIMVMITISMMLLVNGVHPNPGPLTNMKSGKSDINFLTYNCRGLMEGNKLKRLLAKLSVLVNRNCIVALQETHNINPKILDSNWKHKYIRNCSHSNKKGVVLLFQNDYIVNNLKIDKDERYIIADIENDKSNIIIGNVYFPNTIKEATSFCEDFYTHYLEFQFNNPSAICTIMGDFNTCFDSSDYINRSERPGEVHLAKLIRLNNEACGITDSYRHRHPEGGYTWNRGTCFSRLDYIFISKDKVSNVTENKINWELDKSDHAALSCFLKIGEVIVRGRGIVGINSKLMDKESNLVEINNQLKSLIEQIPDYWNPHTKLEYAKVAVRSVFANVAASENKDNKVEIDILEEQINNLINLKITKVKNNKNDDISIGMIANIDLAIDELKIEIDRKRRKKDDDRLFRAGVKWYEEGEKSNKYFLGLLKVRQKQKEMIIIEDEGKKHKNQEGIMNCVTNFYSKLYRKSNTSDVNSDNKFFENCPKLSEANRNELDKNITLEELKTTLAQCKDSAPGSDGIPYSVYKKLWPILGEFIWEAWNHSVETGILPPSHSESALTLLPKIGKDTSNIKNWRPITLTNCDQKLITKALANRMANILDKIVDISQTAYIPGRNVMDNLRGNFYLKNYCKNKEIEGLMISLDAKKAFDSVSHEYIKKVLEVYGIGEKFIRFFTVLYKDLTVRVLVNGHFSEKIDIERGVKQGDALSCSLFILCMDPLIRNINANKLIEGIEITSKITKTRALHKCSGFADDITIVCKNKKSSVENIFKEYERLTRLSGLELNADKTEILRLGKGENNKLNFDIKYLVNTFTISTVNELRICGMYYCNDPIVEYEQNILAKIEKLEIQLKRWMSRNLTTEGKILIIKTFGLSQLIYNLQSYQLIDRDVLAIERLVYKFIWSKDWNKDKFCDHIKRSVLKNEYGKGGLNAPDIEVLNRALKLKQFLRANGSKHVIQKLQMVALENIGYDSVINQEYGRICKDDEVIKAAQMSINNLTDLARSEKYGREENGQSSTIAINEVGSIYIPNYLVRKNKPLELCVFNALKEEGIERLSDLLEEIEISNNAKRDTILKFIESTFPDELMQIAKNFDKSVNEEQVEPSHFYLGNDTFVQVDKITVKQLQSRLKIALNKVTEVDYCLKNKIKEFDLSEIMLVRKQVKNVKLRNVYYRLINNDFYSKTKLKKFKITQDDKCERCQQIETTRHLLWDCHWSQKMWKNLNIIFDQQKLSIKIQSFEDIFNFKNSSCINTIKLRLINELIQIERPKHLDQQNITNIIRNLMKLEKYIGIKNYDIQKYELKWIALKNI